MKILFDCTELSYYNEKSGHRAGVFFVALNLLREFVKREGIEITLICDFSRYYIMKELVSTVDEFKEFKLLEEYSKMNKLFGKFVFYTDKMPVKIKYAVKILSRFYEKYFCKVNKKNCEQIEEYDVYFSPYTPPGIDVESAQIKRFRMIHDIIPIIENGMPKSPKDWYYKIYNSINENDYYVTNSKCTRDDVIKTFKISSDKIKTTLLGANENFVQTDEKPSIEGKYIFSLCTLGKRKNLEFGIKNFFAFIKKHNINDLKLVLGGSIWKKFEKNIDDIMTRYDKSKIVFTGYIDEKDLAKYYANAVCFIYPSLYEGFGLPVLEAMKCGCPVITSNVSSLPEVIGDAGIQINPKSNEEMIRAYEKMYFDSEFRNECKKKGIERAKFFSWEKCASELLEFIKEKSV